MLSSTTGSGTTTLKARPKTMTAPKMLNAKGKPFGKAMKGSPSSPGSKLAKAINQATSLSAALLPGTTVKLYDADHPEWLYAVSSATSDANGPV